MLVPFAQVPDSKLYCVVLSTDWSDLVFSNYICESIGERAFGKNGVRSTVNSSVQHGSFTFVFVWIIGEGEPEMRIPIMISGNKS